MIVAAACNGFPLALASCCVEGWNGEVQNLKKALKLALVEAEKGYHWGQAGVARIYIALTGCCATVSHNPPSMTGSFDFLDCSPKKGTYGKAIQEIVVSNANLAIQQGNAIALVVLAKHYLVVHEVGKAVELLDRAVSLDVPDAMHQLGMLYSHGCGSVVVKHIGKARGLLYAAVAHGRQEAQLELDRLDALDVEARRVAEMRRAQLVAAAQESMHHDY